MATVGGGYLLMYVISDSFASPLLRWGEPMSRQRKQKPPTPMRELIPDTPGLATTQRWIQHPIFAIAHSRDTIGSEVNPMAMSSASDVQVDSLASIAASYEQLDPDFVAELDMLSITIDEYERMLADSEPRIITTDNTVG